MKFTRLLERFDNALIDQNRKPTIIAANTALTGTLAVTAVSLTNSQPLHVAVVDGSGTQLTSFGGGTQYTNGNAAAANPIGTGIIFNNGGTYNFVSASQPLPVTGSLSVGGTVDNSAFVAGTTGGTPAMGFYHSTIDTVTDGRTATVGMTSKRGMFVNLQTAAGVETGVAAVPLQVSLANTGANATAVKVDGSAVTQPVSGTVTAISGTASNLKVASTLDAETTKVIGVTRTADGSGNLITSTSNALDINIKSGNLTTLPVTNAGTFAVQATLQTQTDTVMVGGVNIKEINAVTPLMGNGTTGTGSLRVTIASDNTAFAVNSTLSAETTKVIGVVRNSDGAGNLLTSNSTTYSAKFGLDSNLLGTLGTAFTTAGKVDIKGADGDVFVRQATGSNLHTVIDSGTITAITNALPTGSNVIGHVIADSGSTTAVTGTVATAEVAPTTVLNGKTTVTTAGTRVVLASSTTAKSVTIKALAANTGIIYVGSSTVASTNGFQLAAGDSVSLDIANLNTVNIDSSVNGEGVTYIGVN